MTYTVLSGTLNSSIPYHTVTCGEDPKEVDFIGNKFTQGFTN